MTKLFLLSLTLFFLAPLPAVAHGKSLELATPADVAKACGGDSLTPRKVAGSGGSIRWMTAVGADGSAPGVVGLERVATRHGYFVQATCLAPDTGTINGVTLMRAAPDEVAALRGVMKKERWWSDLAGAKASAVVGALYKSVLGVHKVFSGELASSSP